MNKINVARHRYLRGELDIAMRTLVGARGMSLNMLLQITLLNKSPTANVTFPWFLSPVQHQMMFQICLLDKSLPTDVTFKVRKIVISHSHSRLDDIVWLC